MKNKIQKYLEKNFKTILYYLVGLCIGLILITFSQRMRAAVIITIFITLNIFIVSYKKFIPSIPIEIEILTLGIVLSTIKFGWKEGLIIAIIGGIFSFVFSGNLSPFAFPMLGGYLIIVGNSYFLRGFGITVAGLTSTILANIFVFFAYHTLFRYDIAKNLSFSISNLLINFILFINLAPTISSLLG